MACASRRFPATLLERCSLPQPSSPLNTPLILPHPPDSHQAFALSGDDWPYLRFTNMLIADATYLLDESLKFIKVGGEGGRGGRGKRGSYEGRKESQGKGSLLMPPTF